MSPRAATFSTGWVTNIGCHPRHYWLWVRRLFERDKLREELCPHGHIRLTGCKNGADSVFIASSSSIGVDDSNGDDCRTIELPRFAQGYKCGPARHEHSWADRVECQMYVVVLSRVPNMAVRSDYAQRPRYNGNGSQVRQLDMSKPTG